jgi:hypothetical protein
MGAVRPSKLPTKADNSPPEGGVVPGIKEGGAVWDKPRPKSLGKPKKMDTAKKTKAKAMAKAAGRPYPNLIDNMRAARKK